MEPVETCFVDNLLNIQSHFPSNGRAEGAYAAPSANGLFPPTPNRTMSIRRPFDFPYTSAPYLSFTTNIMHSNASTTGTAST